MRVAFATLDAIKQHAEEGYPNEICGLLLGPRGSGRITEAARARNTNVDRPNDRYEIDPSDMLRIQRAADDNGMDVLGYYHSHPDHPARPSRTDEDAAWAGPLYLIVSCERGKVVDANAFIAQEDRGPFRDEPLELA